MDMSPDEMAFLDALAALDGNQEGDIADALAEWNRSAQHSEGAKAFARDVVRVLQNAVDLGNDRKTSLDNIRNYPIRSFGNKTALDLIQAGRTDDVVNYLQSLSAGYVG